MDSKNNAELQKKKQNDVSVSNRINLDYDWNSEYGDGDIPDIDKNCSQNSSKNSSKNNNN